MLGASSSSSSAMSGRTAWWVTDMARIGADQDRMNRLVSVVQNDQQFIFWVSYGVAGSAT
eukprot:4673110-Pleurochrysis_carterae.AAC.4